MSTFGLAADPAGNLYLSEYTQRVRKISTRGVKGVPYSGQVLVADDGGEGYVFSPGGKHLATVDLESNAVLRGFGYDGRRLVSITDASGNTATIERDGTGTPVSITSPDGLVTNLTIDAANHLRRVTFPDGSFFRMVYTPDGLMTEEFDPSGSRFVHEFDGMGRLLDVYDPEGGRWSYRRSSDDRSVVTTLVTSAEGEVSTFVDVKSLIGGHVVTATSPAGSVSTHTRPADNLTSTDALACGMTEETRFGVHPLFGYNVPIEATLKSKLGLTRRTTVAFKYEDVNVDAVADRFTDTVTVNGKVSKVVNDVLAGTVTSTSPLNRTVTLRYDPATLLEQETSVPGLLPVSYGYDARGRLTSSMVGSRTTTLAYDPNGNLDYLVTPDGESIDYTFDIMGRLRSELLPDGSTLSYDYDANGNLTVLANPYGDAHGFGYTANDQRSSMKTPFSGSYIYGYDRDRRLTGITFPSGRAITNVYADGVLDYSLTPEGMVDYSWECGGKVTGMFRGTESLGYAYDGKLLKADTRAGILNQVISHAYNNDFQLTSMTYAGASQSYGYDNDGLLTLSDGFTITRNAQNGLPTVVTGGPYSETRGFNGYGELDSDSYVVNGNQVYNWSVAERDNAGRIKQRLETIAGMSITWDYAYDNRGRLVEVKRDGAVVESYGYDLQGNRVLETNALRGITGRSSTYSAEDHLLTSGSDVYQWDADGFLDWKSTSEGVTDYHYSSRGELLEALLPDGRLITYEHDPMGRPIAKKVNGVVVEKYLWAGRTTLLATYDGNGNLTARFIYADGRMPVSMTSGGQTYYLAYDQVGSLRTVTDSISNVVKQLDYDSFGNILSDTNPTFSVPFGFAGGLHDRNTGLVRFGFRDYDPAIGRWTAKDPIDFAGGDANLYGYCLGDPVNFGDPNGLDVQGWRQFFHTGHVANLTGEPLTVSGNDPHGPGQLQYVIPPWTLFPRTPFPHNDIDAVYYGNQTIKVSGLLGSWFNLPAWLRPDDYNSLSGWILRGFGLDPVVDPRKEFGPIKSPQERPCK